jgi:UDP-N-acetyl-2-amino-2-deoxyglucuronate dehydrogenase
MATQQRFALIGAAGYIAPRHFKAIRETGNDLVAAVDPHDSVGAIDGYFPEARFFTEIERFDRHLEKLRRDPSGQGVEYVTICSPNYLHDAHVRLALRVHAHAICEKPLVINPWNLDGLAELEQEYGRRVFTVLQLRVHPALVALKERLASAPSRARADVVLSYVTRRGAWYRVSWKGDEARSGGVAMNIGIHFFDLLAWLFGDIHRSEVHLRTEERMAGVMELEGARVRWFLSVDGRDLPESARARGQVAHRSLRIDGEEVEFSEGFTDLHTRVYQEILAGRGYGIADARRSIQAVYDVRRADVVAPARGGAVHPLLAG